MTDKDDTGLATVESTVASTAPVEAARWHHQQLEFLVHDLKNPLGTILTNLRLARPRLADSTVTKLVDDAMQAAERLERMVMNLLDISLLDAGQLALKLIEIRLEDLVDEAIAAVRPMAAARGVTIRLDLGDAGRRVVRVDFDLLTRVLINLLENALRHSPSEGVVRVEIEDSEGSGPTLLVSDQGAGVPEAWRTRIFDAFVQRGADGPRRVGRGLGLAFAKLVADAHGCQIGVRPNEPRGSQFYLDFAATT